MEFRLQKSMDMQTHLCFLTQQGLSSSLGPSIDFTLCLAYFYSFSLHVNEVIWTLHQQSHLQLLTLTEELSLSSATVDWMREMKAQFTEQRRNCVKEIPEVQVREFRGR